MPTILLRHSAIVILTLTLLACGSSPTPETAASSRVDDEEQISVNTLLQLARSSERPLAESYLITAIEMLLEQGQDQAAAELLMNIEDVESLNENLQVRFALVRGRIVLPGELPTDAIREMIRLNATITDNDNLDLPNQIWQMLYRLTDVQLSTMVGNADSYESRGWVELARQVRNNRASIRSELDAIGRWRTVWAQHSAVLRLPAQLASLQTLWDQRPRHIALLLPLQDQVGRAVQEGFLGAYYEAMQLGVEVPRLSLFDTTPLLNPGAPLDIYGLYDTAVAAGADLIIGPVDKALVRQLQYIETLPVPTLALNYTDNALRYSPNLYQFGLAPEDEIRQVAELARRAGFKNAALISPAGTDYLRLQEAFTNYWRSQGNEVVSRATFNNEEEYADLVKQLLGIDASEARAASITRLLPRSDIEFIPRRRQDIDFIFLMANPSQGRQIKPTLSFYYAGDIPVYSLSAIYDGLETVNQRANQDLNGIIFTDSPWVLDTQDPLKQQIDQSLRSTQGPLQRLRALGIDSFRIYSRLGQLARGEVQSFAGVTGILTMTEYGAIQRQSQSAIFVDGRPQPLEPEGLARIRP
ncbi:MAG: penicillin-binding protein activator [Pseudohongiellaceae bacterium]